jgi:transcriptional regulator with XRE-family HTH domain
MLPELMNTSRAQVDRILNAKGNVTIETLQRAAALAHDPEKLQTFRTSCPPGFARPAADETLVFCYRASPAVEFVSS